MTALGLRDANAALMAEENERALAAYARYLIGNPQMAGAVTLNLALARRRHRAGRHGKPSRIAIAGWDLAHNAAGRVRTLADIYAQSFETEIIGATFAHFGERLWAPIRRSGLPCHHFHVEGRASFLRQALDLVLRHPFDIVHLSKPRFPNIVFGLLYKLFWDARVVMDIDDEELGAVRAKSTLTMDELLAGSGGRPKWGTFGQQEWTRAAVGLSDLFDAVTVSNPALQKRYGGLVLPHARPATAFRNSAEHKARSRAEFGIPEDKFVVLFFGTPRRHKGLLETARALAAIGRDSLCLVVVGEFADQELRRELEAIEGIEKHFRPDQPYERIADVVALADACVLLQDVESLLGRYQLPAKLIDALAMNVLVFCRRSPGIQDLVKAGAVVPVTAETLPEILVRYMDDPGLARAQVRWGRAVFEKRLSVESCQALLPEIVGADRADPPLDRLFADARQATVFRQLTGWEMFRAGADVLPAQVPAGSVGASAEKRIIVYSVLVGEYEAVKEPENVDPSVRYILFTDNPGLKSKAWEVVTFDTLGLSPRRASRLPKLLPHRYLPAHDISLYLDASLTIITPDVAGLAKAVLKECDIAAYAHFERDCLYDEITECLKLGKAEPQRSRAFAKRLIREKFPRRWGLLENAFLVRRNTPVMRRINELWFKEYIAGPERDQFSLMYVLWRAGIPHAEIGDARNFRKSPHLRWRKHRGATACGYHPDPAEIAEHFGFLKAIEPAALVAMADRALAAMTRYRDKDGIPDLSVASMRRALDAIAWLEMQNRIEAQGCRYRLSGALIPGAAPLRSGDARRLARIPDPAAAEVRGVQDCGDASVLSRLREAMEAGCTHLATVSPLAAVLAAAVDLPVVLEMDETPGPDLSDHLQFLARSPALVGMIVATAEAAAPIAAAHRDLKAKVTMLDASGDRIAAVAKLLEDARPKIEPPPPGRPRRDSLSSSARRKPVVRWFYGSEKQAGWAYGINASRLSARIPSCDHIAPGGQVPESTPVDVALAFDVLIMKSDDFAKCDARHRILRVGGPTPLKIVSGGNPALLREILAQAQAIIALSPHLRDQLAPLHPSVHFIPNGIDIDAFSPWACVRVPDRPFTVGVSAAMATESERHTKGFHFAMDACELTGADLLMIGRGIRQIPHERLIDEFYSRIDVLLHPVGAGKEASSNVIMEALALGIPVITTRHAGFHGVALAHGREALIMRRTVADLAEAIRAVRADGELATTLSEGGRAFAERHHALDVVAREYEDVIWNCLQGAVEG